MNATFSVHALFSALSPDLVGLQLEQDHKILLGEFMHASENKSQHFVLYFQVNRGPE